MRTDEKYTYLWLIVIKFEDSFPRWLYNNRNGIEQSKYVNDSKYSNPAYVGVCGVMQFLEI